MRQSDEAGQAPVNRAFFRRRADMLPGRPAPVTTIGVLGWLRANLFSSWLNTLLTVAGLLLLWRIVPPLLGWALFNADFSGTTGEECTAAGRLLGVAEPTLQSIPLRILPRRFLLAGQRPALILLIPAVAYVLFDKLPYARYGRRFSMAYLVIAAFLLVGGLPIIRRSGRGRRQPVRHPQHLHGPVRRLHAQPDSGICRHRVVAPDRHPAGARPAFETAGDPFCLHRLHRGGARGAADHAAVRGGHPPGAVPAAGLVARSAHPRDGDDHRVLLGLHGGGDPGRSADDSERPVRGGAGGWFGLLEDAAPGDPAAGAQDLDSRGS